VTFIYWNKVKYSSNNQWYYLNEAKTIWHLSLHTDIIVIVNERVVRRPGDHCETDIEEYKEEKFDIFRTIQRCFTVGNAVYNFSIKVFSHLLIAVNKYS
jgi:hypothetical protein